MARNNGNRKTRAATPEETGENGRGNGNDENTGAITGTGPISGKGPETPGNIGDREVVPAASLDKVYTADSKDTWGFGQPSIGEQLKQKKANDITAAKVEAGELKAGIPGEDAEEEKE